MKGIVFTEFLEMVEEEFGYEVLDKITSIVSLRDGGAYTAVGNYPHGDIVAMVGKLSEAVELEARDLVFAFGRYLFRTFAREYGGFFESVENAADFLEGIETVIHSEVRKLYPDAEPPMFDCSRTKDGSLIMDYQSKRPFADLAEGLISECIRHFGSELEMVREPGPTNDDCSARFVLNRKASPQG